MWEENLGTQAEDAGWRGEGGGWPHNIGVHLIQILLYPKSRTEFRQNLKFAVVIFLET